MRSAYFGSTKGRIPDLRSHGDCILVLKIGFDEVRSHWVCIIFHHPLDELRYTGLKVVRSILVTAGCDTVAGADVFSFLFPVGQIGVHAAQQPDTCFVTNPRMCWAISPDDYEHCPSNNKSNWNWLSSSRSPVPTSPVIPPSCQTMCIWSWNATKCVNINMEWVLSFRFLATCCILHCLVYGMDGHVMFVVFCVRGLAESCCQHLCVGMERLPAFVPRSR